MIRALLAATALTTSMSMAALAQDASTTTDMNAQTDAQVEAPANMDAETSVDADANMAADTDSMVAESHSSVTLSAGYMQSEDDFLGSRILGATVWDSGAEEAEQIGDINDIIFNADGRMIAAVIGIGGFLGIGEKSVAVGFEELEWTTDFNGDPRLVLTGATFETLEAAPEFIWETPELAADPLMTDMDAGVEAEGALDTELPADATPAEGDVETDAMMGAEGDTTMDVDAGTPAEEIEAEGEAGVEAGVEVETNVNG